MGEAGGDGAAGLKRGQMQRREFILALGGAAVGWPFAARAQQPAIPLVGIINAGSAASTAKGYEAFRGELRKLGYVEGRNIRYEYRFADGFLDRLPRLAEELVRLDPAIIVSAPVPANMAVHKVTKTIPIVMSTGADPVGFGLVQSLSHPGGNVTGLTNFAEALASKQLDLMRELRPGLTRVAVLVNVDNPLHVPQWRETQDAAARASIALVPYEFHKPDDFEPASPLSCSRKRRRCWSRRIRLSPVIVRVSRSWRSRRDCRRFSPTGCRPKPAGY